MIPENGDVRPKRIINLSVLPGEPTDGTGKMCIHLFVRDNQGSFTEPCVLQMKVDKLHLLQTGETREELISGPARGRIACNPMLIPSGKPDRKGVVNVTMRSDDPRAVTCPKCMASRDYIELSDRIKQLEASR